MSDFGYVIVQLIIDLALCVACFVIFAALIIGMLLLVAWICKTVSEMGERYTLAEKAWPIMKRKQ